MRFLGIALAAGAGFVGISATARATIADFRVNEVVAGVGGDPQIRFVELFVPSSSAGNCLFSTTRIEVFDAKGQLLGAVLPFVATECYEPGTYFLLATPEAEAHFGVARDARLDVAIPAAAGQVCLASSQTRYDCARWGAVDEAVPFLRNFDDASAGPPIPDGLALARAGDTGVVAADFQLQSPTPRQPNDGTVVPPPDAGPTVDAAPPPPDASPPDARVFTRPDATLPDPPDGSLLDPKFLEADPGGGVMCTCQAGGRAPAGGAAALALFVIWAGLAVRRWLP